MKASRSSGSGGQNVNKRSTKIEITHPPSGAKAVCQTHRTQEQNKKEAFRRLLKTDKFKAWLRVELAKKGVEEAPEGQGGPTGDRGQKIRTYNLVRDEVKDHRSGISYQGAEKILAGDLDRIIRDCRLEGEQ